MSLPVRRLLAHYLLLASVSSLLLGTVGCAFSSGSPGAATAPLAAHKVSGNVHGGQQPVAGAQIGLFAAGRGGTASAARSMLVLPVFTDAAGNFTITGDYACQPGDLVYVTATGGNPGITGNTGNAAIALMTGLGPCANLTATSFVSINEVTTVGSTSALAAFMTGPSNLGSGADAASVNQLAGAFANINAMVDVRSGFALPTSLGGGVVPVTTINSLADALAACINSGSSGSSACTTLLTATNTGVPPTDTLQAAINVARSPSSVQTANIYGLSSAQGPFQPTLTQAPASFAVVVAHPSDVLTYHNNNSRTGVQASETTLTPANVNVNSFGKLRSFPVDAETLANPLYVGGVGMPDGALHNVILVATSAGTVYGFDADGNQGAAGSLWKRSMLGAGERVPTGNDYGCTNPPMATIVGTPVIDRASMTAYMVVKTVSTADGSFAQRLHAISLLDGSERANSPVLIAPVFTGTEGSGTSHTIAFNAQRQLNRAALMLAPNASGGQTVWIAFASHCDIQPYHGLVLGYDTTNFGTLTASFNDSANGVEGGIWMAAGGLAADANGMIYASSGNGTFDANTGGVDYSDTALKLAPPAAGSGSTTMTVADYFTPSNQASLQQTDSDLGGSEGMLINDPGSISPNLYVANDKNGVVYLLDTANMGRYAAGTNGVTGKNADVQDFAAGGTFIYNFAFFNNTLYTSNPFKAYTFVPGTSSAAGHFMTTARASWFTAQVAPTISANGVSNGVVWDFDHDAVLYALSPADLTRYWDSTFAPNGRDTAGGFVKFNSPIVANGKVIVGGATAVTVYGLF